MKRAEMKERRREALIRGAIKVLSDHGLEGFTTGRITAAAGIGQSGFYKYWPDRDAALREVAARVGEEVLRSLRQARLAIGGDPTNLREAFAAALGTLLEARETLVIFLRFRREPGALGDVLRALIARALDELHVDLVRMGIVPEEDAGGRRLAYHVVAACLWSVEALIDGRFEGIEQAADELGQIATHVLRAR